MKARSFAWLVPVAFVVARCANPIIGTIDDAGSSDASIDFHVSFNDAKVEAGPSCNDALCSVDLHSVVDDKGNVVQTCPADQGCACGQCVSACDAAAASKGTIGCDYQVSTPSFWNGLPPACFAVFVANHWAQPTTLTVERGGTVYDVTQFGRVAKSNAPESTWAPIGSTGLQPGEVGVLFLSHDPTSHNGPFNTTCPVAPALSQAWGTAIPYSGQTNATGRGLAWHIKASSPVTAYDIMPYGGASSFYPAATLLYPTPSWGTNYLAVVPALGTSGPNFGQVVASTDNTTVTIAPIVDLPTGPGVSFAPKHAATTFSLGAGEFIQWEDVQEMSGSIIQSDKPIAFVGGTSHFLMEGAGESAHQQIPPISALGSEYALAPYTTRRIDLSDEAVSYRLVGAVDTTTLTFDPPVFGAPTLLYQGQIVDFKATGAVLVRSQDNDHPFYASQVMADSFKNSRPGCSVPGPFNITHGGPCNLGDEEWVNMVPPAQFLPSYVFFTDETYGLTNLVVTRVKTASGFADVNLDCAGALTGWKPVGSSGMYEFTNVDLVRETNIGNCTNGPHTATSAGLFGITVWGLDWNASYAYPAGGNILPINSVIIPPAPK